ncbi:AraC family transcriptional regulator [Robbsia andropogonis]|uniref:AraC family transcriptional regulator n=1 Tax=Robbsia andropogonis TaxID=28092 RepID=A0A0F5K013_9BURK|nr:helix-turn-helix domain-containing protein [Robbsia andropogonis]KKB63423.1 AraC family transcriptional regulator [Robbsia andropogonis]MCP1120385.1 helix-turn-helix domain-containing protein [Robbsia andropogonis]MCP1130261.1 helix-turn-helix domain-containing protein [Robbsia andropogonis]
MIVGRNKTSIGEIPQFSLYGEIARPDGAESVHIELIETRSRIHDWHILPHTHANLFQVLFLMSGRVTAQMEEDVWERDGPVVITIHPSVVHGFDFSKDAVGFVLTVDPPVIFSLGDGNDHSSLFSPLFLRPMAIDLTRVPDLCLRLESLLRLLIEESAWPRTGHTLMLEWLARSVLLHLVRLEADHRSAALSGNGEFELFSRFRALVEEHFKEQWQVGVYAAKLHVTSSRLHRLCVKLCGQSAFDLIQQRLMLEACRKLTYVPSSISSIAYELGFQDPAYFSRHFKRHMGLTPKEYRRTNVLD